jgi:hypothetical protein
MPPKLYKIGRRAFGGCTSLDNLILPVTLRTIGFDAFRECTSLRRIALPRDLHEIEDDDAFSGCDSLSEIAFGGNRESWEYLNHGKTLTVQRTDLSVITPRVSFLDLKGERKR